MNFSFEHWKMKRWQIYFYFQKKCMAICMERNNDRIGKSSKSWQINLPYSMAGFG